MPYIGKGPIDRSLGLNEKNVFTGNGSETEFDITSEALSENALQVFVDNVRQEPGTGKAYTLGLDGSSLMKRITFSAAPANLAEIYVLNSLRTQITETPSDNTITSAKIVGNAVTGAKIADDSIDSEHYAAGSIDNAHLAVNSVDSDQYVDGSIDTDHIAANAVTGAKIAMTSDAQGDVLFYGGTDYERLAAGTSGYFLKTLGSGADPAWAEVPAGAPTGGGTEKVFYENENSVDTDYTLTTNYNAVSAGPVTVASGVTVTIPAGQAWVIV